MKRARILVATVFACVALTGMGFGEWAAQVWPPFSDAVIAEFGS